MFTGRKEYVELCLKNREYEQNISGIQEAKSLEASNKQMSEVNNIYTLREGIEKRKRVYTQFVQGTKKDLLSECVFVLLDKATGYSFNEAQASIMKRNMVSSFINENGVDTLLNAMKSNSYVLAEFSRLVTKYTKIVTEKADKENTDTFCIDPEDRDNFFDELNTDDVEDVARVIKMRVSDSVDQFVQSNVQQKEELKEIIQNSKEKIDAARTEDVKESYGLIAKKAMTNLREKKKNNVLEAMIINVCESAMKNDELKQVYTVEGKLDMDTVVENCTIMYAFLETLHTSKLFKVDETYIKDVLEQLKV